MNPRSGALLFMLLLGLSAGAAAEPLISFGEKSLTASGITPGGKVVWFGVAREIAEHTATLVRRNRIVSDDDRDGAVRLDLDRKVPYQSIWVAIDLTSGASAVATPEGYPLRRLELPVGSLRGEEGKPDWLEDTRGHVEILLARPGTEGAAWGLAVGDGGDRDDDRAYDGRLVASLASFKGIGPSPPAPPQKYGPRDVVVVIDPNQMDVSLRQLTATEVPQ